MITNSKILITGAGGFIGKHITKQLFHGNNDLTGLLIPGETNKYLSESIQLDITDRAAVNSLTSKVYDHIFHFAGIADIRASIKNPVLGFEVNALGTFNLLEAFKNTKIKSFNLASTVSVLSKYNTMPLVEDSRYGPTTPYGASKMTAEAYCIAYNNCFNLPSRIIRLPNVYGAGKKSLVVYDLIMKLIGNPNTLELLGDGAQIRDFIYIDDVITGFILIAEKGLPGEVYHLTSGEPTSITSLARLISNVMGINNLKIVTTKTNYPGELLSWYGDNNKLKELGFKIHYSLAEGIEKTYNSLKH